MRLIGLAILLVASLILTALDAEAQTGGAIPRIGYLSPGRGFPFEALREGLQAHGYVEGSTITINAARLRGTPSACKSSPPSWFDSVST